MNWYQPYKQMKQIITARKKCINEKILYSIKLYFQIQNENSKTSLTNFGEKLLKG